MEATLVTARGASAHQQIEIRAVNSKKVGWLEAEKNCVFLDLEKYRCVSPESLPPSGVHFDVVPNVADELAYDALEKAYNAAFEVSSQARRFRSHHNCDVAAFNHTLEGAYSNSRNHCESLESALPLLMDRKVRAIEPILSTIAIHDIRWWKAEQTKGRQRLIHRLKYDPHSVIGQKCREEVWSERVIQSHPSVFDISMSMNTKRLEKAKVLSELAAACKQRYITKQTRGNSNPTHAISPRLQTQGSMTISTNSIVAQKESTGDLSTLVMARPTNSPMSAPDENKALNEFLVIELNLFVACLLQDRWEIPDIHHIAAVTSIQLCRNHRRAIADFDAERNRMQARVKRNHAPESLAEHRGNVQNVSVDKILQVNPFQSGLCDQLNTTGDMEYGVRDTYSTLAYNDVADSNVCVELDGLRKRGLNSLLLHDVDPSDALFQVRSLLASNAYPGKHLVITSNDLLDQWYHTLVASPKSRMRVYPRSSSKVERHSIYRQVARDSIYGEILIILVCFEDLEEDGVPLALSPWQSCFVDFNMSNWREDVFEAAWMCLLAIPSRQRVFLCNQTPSIDVRLLVQFLFPSLLSSRRKLMAWNCAAFDDLSIQSICAAVVSCAVLVGGEVSREALQLHLINATRTKSTLELSTLDELQREGMVKSCTGVDLSKLCTRNPRPYGGRPSCSNNMEARKKLHKRVLSPSVVASEILKQSPRAKKIPPRRRGVPNETTPRSRKRISRCGKCAGCLAEDCMVCGHCQDMKKYGGPGLRKQSCKHRKCVNPKSWGLTNKKSTRAAKDRSVDNIMDVSVVGGSDRDDSETDECVGVDADDGILSDSSQESDPHPSNSAKGMRDGATRSEIQDIGKKLKVPLSLDEVEDDSDVQDATSSIIEGDRLRSSRTRVMRCGKCKGCTSRDCRICNHCLDMKKYGGPGLRKQSCKNRKCAVPRVMMLSNQAKEDSESFEDLLDPVLNDISAVEKPFIKGLKVKAPTELVGQWKRNSQSIGLHMEHECMMVVRRHLHFSCGSCLAVFTTSAHSTYHNLVKHSTEMKASDWEYEADRLLQHPRYQLGVILNSVGLENGQVRAYAKLKGDDFEFYVLYPTIILGRMTAQWNDLYLRCGIDDAKGLSAGRVDCHVGHDTMIANHHVRISWDAKEGSFIIECLSFRSPISINGRELRYGATPLKLRSRDFVQIGASTFYFLLPREDSEHLKRKASTAIPLPEMEQWLRLRVNKYRAIRDLDQMQDRELNDRVVHTRVNLK